MSSAAVLPSVGQPAEVEAVPDAWRRGTGVSPTEVLAMLAFRLLEGAARLRLFGGSTEYVTP